MKATLIDFQKTIIDVKDSQVEVLRMRQMPNAEMLKDEDLTRATYFQGTEKVYEAIVLRDRPMGGQPTQEVFYINRDDMRFAIPIIQGEIDTGLFMAKENERKAYEARDKMKTEYDKLRGYWFTRFFFWINKYLTIM